jgi:hypothetical protein
MTDPPQRGRPFVDDTLTLEEMVERVLDRHAGPDKARITWVPAEPD